MARIDYNGIKEELKKIILDMNLSTSHEVSIEGDILFDGFDNLIDIEIDSRSIGNGSISYGTRERYQILMIITIWSQHFEKSSAIKIRDDLLSELEFELMKNRSLNGKVDTSWLLGGQNMVAFIEDVNAFVAAGEIRLNIESEIIT